MYKEIVTIGFPTFLETLFVSFATIIDSRMVATIGISAISAVSVTTQPRLFVYCAFFAFNTVTTSLVAKYYGENSQEEANKILDHGLRITLILGAVLSVVSVLLARGIMQVFSGQPDTMSDSIMYFRIVMAGMLFNLIFMEINAAMRGIGQTRQPFAVNVVACVVNLCGNYLLINGNFGFPAWGIKGAAIATVAGNAAACVVSLCFLLNTKRFVNLPYIVRSKYRMTKESLAEVRELSKSCLIDNFSLRATLLVISGITARIGSFELAVFSVGNYLMNVNFALGTGLQTSAVSLIGKSYGENNRTRISEYRVSIQKFGMACAAAFALIYAFGGKYFFEFFSTEADFVAEGVYSSIFIAVITIFQVLKFIYNGCLQGVEKMRAVMWCSVIAYSGVNLLMVALLVLVFHMGLKGVWISTLASQMSQSLMLYYCVRRTPVLYGKAPESDR